MVGVAVGLWVGVGETVEVMVEDGEAVYPGRMVEEEFPVKAVPITPRGEHAQRTRKLARSRILFRMMGVDLHSAGGSVRFPGA